MKYLISPFLDPYTNLAIENYFFRLHEKPIEEQKGIEKDLLFFYVNEPCLIMGRFQNPWQEVNWPSLKTSHLPLLRRQSGGGTVYHDRGNLNFSFIRGKKEIRKESNLEQELSILDNFMNYAYGDNEDQKMTRARMACSDLEITNFINTPVKNLSTGQFQRTLLGLTLVSNAEFVILDEPFSHLESPLKEELSETIFPLLREQKTSVLWISHDKNLLMKFCDEIAIMNFGEIKQKETPENLYFFPKNLFSADFLGPCNKEILSNHFSTTWNKTFEGANFLLYRPEAITIHMQEIQGTQKASILDFIFMGNYYLYLFSLAGNEVWAPSFHKLDSQKFFYLGLNEKLISTCLEI